MSIRSRWLTSLALSLALVTSRAGATLDGSASAGATPVLHVVLIGLRADAPASAAAELIADSKALLMQVEGVQDVRAGRRAAAERDVHVKDYDVALCVRLARLEDLEVYARHPRHVELLARHRARIANLRVIDFFAE